MASERSKVQVKKSFQDAAATAASGAEVLAEQILSSLPTPVFVLDGQNRFVYLNQAGEMFFHSSKPLLIGLPLDSFISADSILFSMLQRSREQHLSVADQGLELANPKMGPKLVNVQITPFGETPPRLLLSIQNVPWPNGCVDNLFLEELPDQFHRWQLC